MTDFQGGVLSQNLDIMISKKINKQQIIDKL